MSMESATQTTSPDLGRPSPVLSALSVKLPPFWTTNALAWFEQAEAQFVLCNIIHEETRYLYVISTLDAATAVRVSPLFPALTSQQNYPELKNLLIKIYGLSDDEWARIFWNICELGCCNFMALRSFILRFAFKHLLPAPVSHALSAFPYISLRQWAKEADQLMADHNDQRFTNVAAVRSTSPARPLPPLLLDLQPVVGATNTSSRSRDPY